jgi:hypothetical protein
MLSSQGRYQQIELRHHAPREAKLLEKLGKFNRCLFVRGPKTESSQSELETGQVCRYRLVSRIPARYSQSTGRQMPKRSPARSPASTFCSSVACPSR